MNQEQPIKLHMHYFSQPSRAIAMFCEISKIPYQPIVVELGKGQHLGEEYK